MISNELVSRMRPGSVLVDIAIDQGGCFEDSRPTTHDNPTYPVHNSVFYCVANMPGAVPHTSTYALTNVTLPYAVSLANKGWQDALRADPSLALGLNTYEGELVSAPVAAAHEMPHRSLDGGAGLSALPLNLRTGRWIPSRHPDSRRVAGRARRIEWCGFQGQRTAHDRRWGAVGSYLDHLRVERGVSPHTAAAYRRDLVRYADFLAGPRRRRAGAGHVRVWSTSSPCRCARVSRPRTARAGGDRRWPRRAWPARSSRSAVCIGSRSRRASSIMIRPTRSPRPGRRGGCRRR